jgi:hypothetical protein
MFPLVALIIACGGPQDWSGPADCEALSAGANKDECWAQHATTVFKEDVDRGIKIVEEQVGDRNVQDFIWLTITREVDPSSYKYCDRIQETALAERCRVLVSRPHLHRELLRDREGGAEGPPARGPGGQGGHSPKGGGPPPPQGGAKGPQGGSGGQGAGQPPAGGPQPTGGTPPAGHDGPPGDAPATPKPAPAPGE